MVNPEQSQHIYCKGLPFFFFPLEISQLALIKFLPNPAKAHKALEREGVRVHTRVCWMGFLQVFLPLMKVPLAVPIRTGCSQASGGLTPRGLALGSHTGARRRESSISLLMTQRPVQNMQSYKTSKISISNSSPDIFLLFLSVCSLDY